MIYLRLPRVLGAAAVLAFAGPLGTTALAAELSPAQDSACEVSSLHSFTQGHQDMALMDSGSGFAVLVRDDASGADYHEGEFYVRLGSMAEFSPGPAAELPSGFPTSGWALPQTQDPAVPWLGFNTSYVSNAAAVTGTTVTMRLGSAPPGGRVVGFQSDVQGLPTVLFDSDDPSITWDFPDHAHAHTGMIFTEPGAYAVTFSYELAGGASYSLDVPFLVGEASAEEICQLEWPDSASGVEEERTNLSRPKQITKEINDTAAALGGLDKALDTTRTEAEKMVGAAPRQHEQKPAAKANQEPQQQSGGGSRPSGPALQRTQRTEQTSSAQRAPKKDTAGTERSERSNAAQPRTEATPYSGVRAMSYQEPMTSFWAGVLAGMGVFATILGVVLFIWVQFFRQR